MEELITLSCKRPEKGEGLTADQISAYAIQVPEWKIYEVEGVARLERSFKFKNFSQALGFSVQIGILAEKEDHHPALTTEWGKTTVTFWTHFIQGLHLNDFIAAAKADQIYREANP